MHPQYVAKRSKATAFTPLRILCLVLLFWTIVPIVYIVIQIILADHDIMEFYEDSVIIKDGWISKSEKKVRIDGIVAVSINQSFIGAIFNYGDVNIDFYGKHDHTFYGVADPKGFKDYLERRIDSSDKRSVMHFEQL